MPEGHSVHRIALQLGADLVGYRVRASSPQGRFAAGAELLDGSRVLDSRAVGKHLLVAFDTGGTLRWLRVHLGLYGAWDFHGQVSPLTDDGAPVRSIGAPRARRDVRMGEADTVVAPGRAGEVDAQSPDARSPDVVALPFPPDPVGQVRLRLMTEHTVADLRGPSACEVLTPDDVACLLEGAGPDPRVLTWTDPLTGGSTTPWPDPEGTVVERITRRGVAIGQLLMDPSVVSGIGNIYRAEMLFRAGLDPHTPGRQVSPDVVRDLWRDWVGLLDDGVRTGVMLTRADVDHLRRDVPAAAAAREAAIAEVALRYAVYGRADQPCLVCGNPVRLELMAARKLYWCATCQT